MDFFELTPGPASQKRSNELLNWWSRYVLLFLNQDTSIPTNDSFSKVFGKHTLPLGVSSKPNSSVSRLANQRAARELEAANALLGLGSA